jgi:hypothetical protein
MITAISIAELRGRGVDLSAAEAVAVCQALIAGDATEWDTQAPFGLPSPANVFLRADGSVVCRGCAATLTVLEAAIFLQALLPSGSARVPGGLRYATARALLEVEVPPFESLEEFSRAIARFEDGDRHAVVARLVARAERSAVSIVPVVPAAADGERRDAADEDVPSRHDTSPPLLRVADGQPSPLDDEPEVRFDRRRGAPRSDQLRRQLREADRELFELRVAMAAAAGPRRTRRVALSGPIAACFLAGLGLVAIGGLNSARDAAPPVVAAPVAPAPPARATASPIKAPSSPAVDAAKEDDTAAFAASRAASPPLDRDRLPAAPPTRAPGDPQMAGMLVRALDEENRPVFSPAFASSGTAIFFHRGRSGDVETALMAAEESDHGLRVMTIVDDGSKNYHVQPSPDGRLIAFDSDRDGERGVYVAQRDGSGVRRVSGSGYAAVPTWSPDASRLAFVRAEASDPRVWNLWLLHLESGQATRLTSFRYGQTWGASWFPDGQRVVYSHETDLIIHDLRSGRTRTFPTPVAGRLVRTPAVSPDGTKVIFQVYRDGAWLLDLEDQSMRSVLTDPTAEEFAWSPDGRRVAFHSRRSGEWGIWTIAPAGVALR